MASAGKFNVAALISKHFSIPAWLTIELTSKCTSLRIKAVLRLPLKIDICGYSDQNEALKILTHPQHQGAVNGDKVTFAVVAEGSEHLSYEWLKDGVSISDPSVKAKSSIFTIPSFLPAEHKGSYQCIVSSDVYDGSVDLAMSKPAELKGNI